jgi:hypothetical protein
VSEREEIFVFLFQQILKWQFLFSRYSNDSSLSADTQNDSFFQQRKGGFITRLFGIAFRTRWKREKDPRNERSEVNRHNQRSREGETETTQYRGRSGRKGGAKVKRSGANLASMAEEAGDHERKSDQGERRICRPWRNERRADDARLCEFGFLLPFPSPFRFLSFRCSERHPRAARPCPSAAQSFPVCFFRRRRRRRRRRLVRLGLLLLRLLLRLQLLLLLLLLFFLSSCVLRFAFCFLRFAFLRFAFCFLFSVFCFLLSAFCFLLSAFFTSFFSAFLPSFSFFGPLLCFKSKMWFRGGANSVKGTNRWRL